MNSATSAVRIRAARATDAALVSDIAIRSKAYWGYSPEFMAACKKELTFAARDITDSAVFFSIAETDAGPAGFYALRLLGEREYELDALFVEPEQIGIGIGCALLQAAKDRVARAGGGSIVIQGDPHADRFYRAAGGVLIGERESGSIAGRLLPLFRIPVDADANAG
jgi:GNAT superfamily N-acetyltransferase